MAKNRYAGILERENHQIIDMNPSNHTLRIVLALSLNELLRKTENPHVIELGCGEGDLTMHLLRHNPDLSIEALDVSKRMLKSAKAGLVDFDGRVKYVLGDAENYLAKHKSEYDAIVSAWVIHNFTWPEKMRLLNTAIVSLKPQGRLLAMDKIFPDNRQKSMGIQRTQLQRYGFLEPELRDAIVQHETRDFTEIYKMTEMKTFNALHEAGFRQIKIVDRVERDVVLIATK